MTTTLKLISNYPPYMFKSLGVYNPVTRAYDASNDFPTGTQYELTAVKYPLTDYNDTFDKSGLFHTLDNNIKVKITGFTYRCREGHIIDGDGSCEIEVEKDDITGGRKNKSNRRKTNRRKTNRRL